MIKNSIVELEKPAGIIEDPLTEVLRNGAQELIARAVQAEVSDFLTRYDDVRDENGRQIVDVHSKLTHHFHRKLTHLFVT